MHERSGHIIICILYLNFLKVGDRVGQRAKEIMRNYQSQFERGEECTPGRLSSWKGLPTHRRCLRGYLHLGSLASLEDKMSRVQDPPRGPSQALE